MGWVSSQRKEEGSEGWNKVQRKKTFAEALGKENKKGAHTKDGWKMPHRREEENRELIIERDDELVTEVKGMIREAGVSMVRSVKVGDGKVVAVFVRDQEKEKMKQTLRDKKEVRVWEKGVQAPNCRSRGWKEILVALYEENMDLWDERTYEDCMKGARVLFRRMWWWK